MLSKANIASKDSTVTFGFTGYTNGYFNTTQDIKSSLTNNYKYDITIEQKFLLWENGSVRLVNAANIWDYIELRPTQYLPNIIGTKTVYINKTNSWIPKEITYKIAVCDSNGNIFSNSNNYKPIWTVKRTVTNYSFTVWLARSLKNIWENLTITIFWVHIDGTRITHE